MLSTGHLAGMAASLCWASSSLVFSRIKVPAGTINRYKNLVGTVLLLGVLVVLIPSRGAMLTASGDAWLWLALSSIAGLVIGDTCYFRSLQILGARRSLVLTLAVPPFSAVGGLLLLGQDPAGTWFGMIVTLLGVAIVVLENAPAIEKVDHFPGSRWIGVSYGLVGALCQAIGAIWTKKAMDGAQLLAAEAHDPVEPVEAAFIRLLLSVLMGWAWLFCRRGTAREGREALRQPGIRWRLTLAAFSGTFLGIWLSLVAYDTTRLAVATTLTSLSPVWIIPIVAMVFRTRPSARALLGAAIALVGVMFLVGVF